VLVTGKDGIPCSHDLAVCLDCHGTRLGEVLESRGDFAFPAEARVITLRAQLSPPLRPENGQDAAAQGKHNNQRRFIPAEAPSYRGRLDQAPIALPTHPGLRPVSLKTRYSGNDPK